MEAPGDVPEWRQKQKEYEIKKARAKALKLRLTCTICGEKAKLNCPCGTTQCDPGARGWRARAARRVPGCRHARLARYCTTECQRIDWRDRGHRKACKKIRDERAAEAARAEAPPPTPEVVYGPAPRSHADEVRARIAAEHEAARVRREANPEREPTSARWGSRCPICLEEWDVNDPGMLRVCCCRTVCRSCEDKIGFGACPLCRMPGPENQAELLARLRRHVENEVPEAITHLANAYSRGYYDLVKSDKKAAKIYRRAVELGNVTAMNNLGRLYETGSTGVKLDKKKAMKLYRAAADRGGAFAQYNLAVELHSDEKFEEAFRYLVLAANQGFTPAEHNLGCFYRDGTGTEVDLGKAIYWVERAAAKGEEAAKAALALLDARV